MLTSWRRGEVALIVELQQEIEALLRVLGRLCLHLRSPDERQ